MKSTLKQEAIVAVSTPIGEGAISVIRLTGSEALMVADQIFESCRNQKPSVQKSFTSQVGFIIDKSLPETPRVDEVMLQVMRAPKSYTRENMIEISCHGGRQVTRRVLEVCLKAGARMAEAGEFTKRAFLNGRIDLAQAEAVGDLIRSKSDRAYDIARRQLEGSFSHHVRSLRHKITETLSHAEADIDFPEDDISPEKNGNILDRLKPIEKELNRLIEGARSGVLIREGLSAVLVGEPNAGKSSLMNRLVGMNRVIVSPKPGTTRDAVEELIQIRGLAVRLRDTAGLGLQNDAIDREAAQKTRSSVSEANLMLFVADGSSGPSDGEKRFWEELSNGDKMLIINKTDIARTDTIRAYEQLSQGSPCIQTSCLTGEGLESLEQAIQRFILQDAPERSDEAWVGSLRQRDLIRKAHSHITNAQNAIRDHLSTEFASSDLRMAAEAVGEITGETISEEVLDKIFSQFCIGK